MENKIRRKVPEVLWRLFKNRARTLHDTILAISQQAHPGELIILYPGDSPEYRHLLNQTFVVVSLDAPPLIYSSTFCGSTQLQVGDKVMTYLIENSSIFIPLQRKKFYQISGPSVSKLAFKLPQRFIKPICGSSSAISCLGPPITSEMSGNVSYDLRQGVGECNCVVCNGCTRSKSNENDSKSSTSRKRKRRRRKQKPDVCTKKYSCPCCSLIYSSSLLPKGIIIHRKNIFYNLEHNILSAFPRKHSLVRSIFGFPVRMEQSSTTCCHSRELCGNDSPCIYHILVKSFRRILRRLKSCQHTRLFDRHCGEEKITPGKKRKRLINENDKMTHLKSYCSKNQVVSFLWAICRSIIPPDLLGSHSNWRALRKNIWKFINLRRHEKFSLTQCMHSLKITHFPFLSRAHSLCRLNDSVNDLKHTLLRRWIFWFFSQFINPLLQANFYVTESQNAFQEVFFYPNSTWQTLRTSAIFHMMDGNYQLLGIPSVDRITRGRAFGFSKLRFLPKDNGLRMLANLKAPSSLTCRPFIRRFRSVNNVLRDTHAILKGLLHENPGKLGSSVFDYNDVYRKLVPFAKALREEPTSFPHVYAVVADVSKAFDSINQDKLFEVMLDVITDDNYCLEKVSHVFCSKSSIWTRGALSSKTSSNAFHLGSLESVVVKEGTRSVRKEEIFHVLKEHVKRNIVRVDKRFYLQTLGVAQGSAVSSQLCSVYYGHLENNVVFPFLERIRDVPSHRCLLMRFIDDFLFISTSKAQAQGFLSRLHRGFHRYNCYMNDSKFGFNFDVSGIASNRVHTAQDGVVFLKWSGLLLNSRTLHVQADYSKYLNFHIRSTLTTCAHDKPGRNLKRKVLAFLRPKCHVIFFDSNINSEQVVRLNVYQVFVICAMKFHCYVAEIAGACRLPAGFLFKIIKNCTRYMHKLIQRRASKMSAVGLRPVVRLHDREVEWLGIRAFVYVLRRKQSRHKQLLKALGRLLSSIKLSKDDIAVLRIAIEKSHSSILSSINY